VNSDVMMANVSGLSGDVMAQGIVPEAKTKKIVLILDARMISSNVILINGIVFPALLNIKDATTSPIVQMVRMRKIAQLEMFRVM